MLSQGTQSSKSKSRWVPGRYNKQALIHVSQVEFVSPIASIHVDVYELYISILSTLLCRKECVSVQTTINDVLEYAPVGTSAVVFKRFCVIHCCPKIRGIVERCNATHIEVVLLERSHAVRND
eukprot:scaffold375_cov175-Skeletonema_dohrnii-CCMP3373.AAC.4